MIELGVGGGMMGLLMLCICIVSLMFGWANKSSLCCSLKRFKQANYYEFSQFKCHI